MTFMTGPAVTTLTARQQKVAEPIAVGLAGLADAFTVPVITDT
jgi:hypothetical protein